MKEIIKYINIITDIYKTFKTEDAIVEVAKMYDNVEDKEWFVYALAICASDLSNHKLFEKIIKK